MLDQISQRWRERVAVLDARLGDLSGKSLGNFSSLGDAAPFCNQAGHIGACGEKTTSAQCLDVESNRCFVRVLVPASDFLSSRGAYV